MERANDVGGTTLAFATNGTISLRRDYVVLGVDVDTPSRTAARLNALSPAFGIPMTVCTNVDRAAGIDLVTRVRLAAGGWGYFAIAAKMAAFHTVATSCDPPSAPPRWRLSQLGTAILCLLSSVICPLWYNTRP